MQVPHQSQASVASWKNPAAYYYAGITVNIGKGIVVAAMREVGVTLCSSRYEFGMGMSESGSDLIALRWFHRNRKGSECSSHSCLDMTHRYGFG